MFVLFGILKNFYRQAKTARVQATNIISYHRSPVTDRVKFSGHIHLAKHPRPTEASIMQCFVRNIPKTCSKNIKVLVAADLGCDIQEYFCPWHVTWQSTAQAQSTLLKAKLVTQILPVQLPLKDLFT